MIHVLLENITVEFGKTKALDDLSLGIEQGEFVALLGPSGCGKTTLLRTIAGFIRPDNGNVYIHNKLVNRVPPYEREIGFVFQNYALFPHKTVGDNVAFGLRMRKLPKDEIKIRVQEAFRLLKLEEFESRFPFQLSGGQQQRVALARAIVINPRVLLLDEPLGALDKKLREEMQIELKNLQKSLAITTIFVTHDQEEALTMADRIAVISGGRIEQVGSPKEVYERPKKKFVSSFIGTSNFMRATFLGMDNSRSLFEDSSGMRIVANPLSLEEGKAYEISVRPEKISILRYEDGGETLKRKENVIMGHITNLVYLGTVTHIYVETDAKIPIIVYRQNLGMENVEFSIRDNVVLTWKPENSIVLQ